HSGCGASLGHRLTQTKWPPGNPARFKPLPSLACGITESLADKRVSDQQEARGLDCRTRRAG
ncbi:hypothetical protein, partial [Methylorubrum extorquens]|uniref:hypothetical protein n=1 Tax=Methylorubrum extorquens TaxID=408 RepID=UPI001AEC6F82